MTFTLSKSTRFTSLFIACVSLGACTFDPFVEDWDRERFTSLQNSNMNVNICFNHSRHTRNQVEEIAREECADRINELEKIAQVLELQAAQNQTRAEGRAFRGPVARQNDIKAQITTLQLQYKGNDKWDCPLMAPNRITYACYYNQNAVDSTQRTPQNLPTAPEPDLPPELPEDLKPQ